jgi:hypothetical protein
LDEVEIKEACFGAILSRPPPRARHNETSPVLRLETGPQGERRFIALCSMHYCRSAIAMMHSRISKKGIQPQKEDLL